MATNWFPYLPTLGNFDPESSFQIFNGDPTSIPIRANIKPRKGAVKWILGMAYDNAPPIVGPDAQLNVYVKTPFPVVPGLVYAFNSAIMAPYFPAVFATTRQNTLPVEPVAVSSFMMEQGEPEQIFAKPDLSHYYVRVAVNPGNNQFFQLVIDFSHSISS